jgi:hypothetical protein
VVVMNGPLPTAPGAVPMADAGTPPTNASAEEDFAEAYGEDVGDYAAKTHSASGTAHDHDDIGSHAKTRLASAGAHRVSVSSDEAKILREREAWLRGLDRKYGINTK